MCGLLRIWICNLVVERYDQEGHNADGIKLGERFFRYVGEKRQAKVSVSPLVNEKRVLTEMDNTEVTYLISYMPWFSLPPTSHVPDMSLS